MHRHSQNQRIKSRNQNHLPGGIVNDENQFAVASAKAAILVQQQKNSQQQQQQTQHRTVLGRVDTNAGGGGPASSGFGGASNTFAAKKSTSIQSFSIYQDENDTENAPPNQQQRPAKVHHHHQRSASVKPQQNQPSVRSRKPLASIPTSSNLPAATAFSKPQTSAQPFQIFCDPPSMRDDAENVAPSAPAPSTSRECYERLHGEDNEEPMDSDDREAFWADKIAKLPSVGHGDMMDIAEAQNIRRTIDEGPREENKRLRVPLGDLNIDDGHLYRSQSCGNVLSDEDEDKSSQIMGLNEEERSSQIDRVGAETDEEDEEEEDEEEQLSPRQREVMAMFDASEYSGEIYDYLRETEMKHVAKWNYMTKQPDITFSMRAILVDWLVEVAEEYKLHQETIYLAVNYIDRFLSVMSVQRPKLQLVGTACMFIAAKYEEIYPPDVGEFVYITDDTYSKKQVLRMEHLVLKVLDFNLSVPSTLLFANLFSRICKSNEETTALAQYLGELTLLDAKTFLSYRQSVIGASAVALARHTLGFAAWPDHAVEKSSLAIEDIKECLVELHEAFTAAPQREQQAIHDKYKSSKYHSVANVTPTPIF